MSAEAEPVYANCPECGLTLTLRAEQPRVERCPRCLARRGVAVAMTAMHPGALRVEDEDERGCHRLHISGEVDITTATELEARVVALCSAGASEIVLDLGGVEFIDSRGITAILLCRKRCASRGCEFRMTRGGAQVQHLFEVTGIAELATEAPAAPPVRAEDAEPAPG